MVPLEAEPEDDVAKIARYAASKGHWSERSARDMAAQARLHHASPRAFLRKMLEIKGGLTYDEIARLEKEALAPPAPPPPGKPLPKPFDGAETPPAAPEIAGQSSGKALPKPFEAASDAATASSPPNQIAPMATPSRSLPRLTGKSSSSVSPALGGGATPAEGTILKRKLPSLGGKKASSPELPADPPREPSTGESASEGSPGGG